MAPEDDASKPILIAYDGSEHAKAAIEQAGRQLPGGRRATVLSVWQPVDSMPFTQLVVVPQEFVDSMMEGARETAAEGATLAREAGFDAAPLAESANSAWEGIVKAAEELDAALIVMGSHGRSGLSYATLGSVATAVAHHTERPVMIFPMR